MHAPVAIITGAGRGIGRAIALELANRGYRLALASRNQQELEAVAAQAKTAIAVPTDITRPNDVQMLVDKTNLSSAFYLTRAVWETFKEQHAGCIVNISSMSSRDPLPGFAAYGAAKAGLNLLSLVLAREGAAHGIRSYTIAPGAVETSMFRRMVSKEKWPVEKTLDPADVARVVAQCIDGDLKYTSGEVIFLSKTL